MIRPFSSPGSSRTMILAWGVSCVLVGLADEARSDVIAFTGNVANDFPTTSPGVSTFAGQPGSVAEAPYILQNGWTTGFLVESLRLSYDKTTDTLFVGVQTYSIAGDADGNGKPGYTDPQMAAAGGVNSAHFGGDKSLTIAFAAANAAGGLGSTNFVAGIPADKSVGDSRNTNDFTVATYKDTGRGLAYSYGTILNNHVGSLAVDPSASAPNFEFALTNFSKFPGFNPSQGYYVSLFQGSQQAIVVGKEALDWIKIPPVIPEPGGINGGGGPLTPLVPGAIQPVPEPASVVLFLVGSAALAGSFKRSRARAQTSGSTSPEAGSMVPTARA